MADICEYDGCQDDAVHRCAFCDLWTCDMHYEHGPSGDGPHTAGLGGLRLPEPEPTRLERENAALRAQLAEAEKVAEEWWHGAGWASGHGDTLADILREMRSQHSAQLAEAQAAWEPGIWQSGDGTWLFSYTIRATDMSLGTSPDIELIARCEVFAEAKPGTFREAIDAARAGEESDDATR